MSDLALDSNKESRVRVNFNVTMMDLPCRYAVIDVVSVLGTQQNVTKHVAKWDVSAEGVRQRYQGRNREQHDIELFDPDIGGRDSMEELLENGEDAISLDEQTFEFAKHKQEFLFVDFFANCEFIARRSCLLYIAMGMSNSLGYPPFSLTHLSCFTCHQGALTAEISRLR